MAYLHEGNPETASAIVGEPTRLESAVLLDAWAALSNDPTEALERARQAVRWKGDDVLFWRRIASVAESSGDTTALYQALQWLANHEVSQRLKEEAAKRLRQFE